MAKKKETQLDRIERKLAELEENTAAYITAINDKFGRIQTALKISPDDECEDDEDEAESYVIMCLNKATNKGVDHYYGGMLVKGVAGNYAGYASVEHWTASESEAVRFESREAAKEFAKSLKGLPWKGWQMPLVRKVHSEEDDE